MSRSKKLHFSGYFNVALAAGLWISTASLCSAGPGMRGMQGMQGMPGMRGMQSNDATQQSGTAGMTTLRGRLEGGEKDSKGTPTSLSFVTEDQRVFAIRDAKKVAELSPHIGHQMTLSGRVGDSIDAQGSAGSSGGAIPGRVANQPQTAPLLQVDSFQMNTAK